MRYKIFYINLPKQFRFLFLFSLPSNYFSFLLVFSFSFLTYQESSQCIFKNISRMFSYLSKWPGEETAITCLKLLFYFVTDERHQKKRNSFSYNLVNYIKPRKRPSLKVLAWERSSHWRYSLSKDILRTLRVSLLRKGLQLY